MIIDAVVGLNGPVTRESFGALRIGMSREEVRELFGASWYKTFRRGQDGPETDRYGAFGEVMVNIVDSVVSFVELAEPARPTIRGVELLGVPLSELAESLAGVGLAIDVIDGAMAVIIGEGIGLYLECDVVRGVSFSEP